MTLALLLAPVGRAQAPAPRESGVPGQGPVGHWQGTLRASPTAALRLALDVSLAGDGTLGATLRSKGIEFAEQCKVFEVCNPAQAAKVLSADMRLNMALPCRISVYTEQGQTRLGLITPVKMLTALSQDPALQAVAREVEDKTILMIEQAK